MTPEARARGEAGLRGLRLGAAYLAKRLSVSPRTRSLAYPLVAREAAAARYLEHEAILAGEVVRAAGVRDALRDALRGAPEAERPGLQARLDEVHAEIGVLRAERARLDARLLAELRAFRTTERQLRIRLSTTARGL